MDETRLTAENTHTEPVIDQQRALDLLRYVRHYLFDTDLITKEELTSLLQREGAVPRLEGYDALRAENARLREALRVIHEIATRELVEPSNNDTAVLVSICTAVEAATTALSTPAPPDPRDAQIAMMREALEKSECWCPRLFICPHCGGDVVEGQDQYAGSWICGKCVRCVILPRDEGRKCTRCAALSADSGEWREEQRREAQIEVLEALPCTDTNAQRGKSCIECRTALLCQRCKALAALKGGGR